MSDATKGPRLLTSQELADLKREMAESSLWMKAELKRMREAGDKGAVRGQDDAPVWERERRAQCQVRGEGCVIAPTQTKSSKRD